MKNLITILSALACAALLVGCVSTPTRNFSVPLSEAAQKADVLEIAIEVAKTMDFPAVHKLDKQNGIVEFGDLSSSQMGLAAQVRVLPNHSLDVTVRRLSVYVPLPVEETANEFKKKIEARLAEIH